VCVSVASVDVEVRFYRADAEKQPLKSMVGQAQLEAQWAKEDKEFTQFSCSLKLCVAFAANVGGVGTLIGCGPNIVLKGQVDEYVTGSVHCFCGYM